MEINWLMILVCGVAAMVIGATWHGPLFGKAFMRALGADMNMSPEKMAEIQKKMWQLYILQFVLVVFEAWILSLYIGGSLSVMTPMSNAIWIWAGFVLPTVAGQWMWSPRPRKLAWQGFFISAGYNLVLFIVFAIIIKAMM